MHCKLQLNLGLGAVSPKNALFSAKSRVWTHCSGNGGPVIPLITSFRPQLVKTAANHCWSKTPAVMPVHMNY